MAQPPAAALDSSHPFQQLPSHMMTLPQLQLKCRAARCTIGALHIVCCAIAAPLACAADDVAALLRSPPGLDIPLHPLDVRIACDAADGKLDEFSLPAAALVAAGVHDPEVLAQYEQQFDAWGDELGRDLRRRTVSGSRGAIAGTPRERARAIFEFLHRRILTGSYDADCTELTRTLDEGTYNCVSSLLLYRALCQRFVVDVKAVETPGHSLAMLVTEGMAFEIETTCPDWFELSDAGRRRRQVRAGPDQRYANENHPEKARGAAHRELSGPALVAIVYYNRAIDLLHRDAFAQAVAANQMALRLDPASVDARENLLATLNNWALDLFDRGEREQSLAVLQFGLAAAPDHAKLRRNYVAISQRQANDPARAERATARAGSAGNP
jgi:tetratricopeptide (TPR) repeat protein